MSIKKDNKNYRKSDLIFAIIITILLLICIIGFLNSHKHESNNPTITKLNETYNGDLIITATDIKAISIDDEEDAILVGVRFVVENNTNYNYSLTGYTLSTYVDDISVNSEYGYEQLAKFFNTENEELYSRNIKYGKKTMGYEVVKAKKSSKKIEFSFTLPDLEKTVWFSFDIPPVEE